MRPATARMKRDFERRVCELDKERSDRLLAAAPDLLAALQSLTSKILDYERVNNLAPNPQRKYCWDETERAVAAIAKATGATP